MDIRSQFSSLFVLLSFNDGLANVPARINDWLLNMNSEYLQGHCEVSTSSMQNL